MTCDKSFADKLIANGGRIGGGEYPDNPFANRIVEYTNAFGGIGYGVTFEGRDNPEKYMRESFYIRSPRIYWERPVAPPPRTGGLLLDDPTFREEYMHEARHDDGGDR